MEALCPAVERGDAGAVAATTRAITRSLEDCDHYVRKAAEAAGQAWRLSKELGNPNPDQLLIEADSQLLAGDLVAADVPEAWDAAMESMLGIRPPDVRQGALQDIHWSLGLFGYFPTYALGNCYAASFQRAMERDLDLESLVSQGEFGEILRWLRTRVHQQGSRLETVELIRDVTGEGLSAEPLLSYLGQKFGALYGLD